MRYLTVRGAKLAFLLYCQLAGLPLLSAAQDCVVSSVTALEDRTAPRPINEVTLALNVDFHDLVVQYQREQPQRVKDSIVYPCNKYKDLLNKAADSGIGRLYFRVAALGRVTFPGSGIKPVHPSVAATTMNYDPLQLTLDVARSRGMEVYVWMTPFDDAGNNTRAGEIMPNRSRFSREHPELQMASPIAGEEPLWGFYSFADTRVRQYWKAQVEEIYKRYQRTPPDGFFFSDRTHSNIDEAKQEFGFNPEVVREYIRRYGVNPHISKDLKKFSALHGEYYTIFLREMSAYLKSNNLKFHVKASWNNNNRISPRLGGLHRSFFDTETWTREKLIDALIIGGDTASGNFPEFVITSFDDFSLINDPRNFSRGDHSIQRWLTLFDWGIDHSPENAWQTRSPENSPGNEMVTAEVVRKAVALSVRSGVDSIQLHEALLIDLFNDWKLLSKLTCRIDDGRDTDGDGSSDCEECRTTTGTIGCPASFENPYITAIIGAYRDVIGDEPGEKDLKFWLPAFKSGAATSASLREWLTDQLVGPKPTALKRDLINRAFVAARGSRPDVEEMRVWLSRFTSGNRLTYAGVFGSGIANLALMTDEQIDNMIRGAIYHTRADAPRGFAVPPLATTERTFFRRNGYIGYVLKLQSAHRLWPEIHIDYVIREAYRSKGKTANDVDLKYWRPIFRKGDTTFRGLAEIVG